jgi:type IX secretion system PorP/SprF family membrane protein
MKHFFLIATILMFASNVRCQQNDQMSFYQNNPLAYNPAYCGSKNSLNLLLSTRLQWIGFDGAPITNWMSIHAPIFNNRFGIGAHVINDQLGNRHRTSYYLDYSGIIPLNSKKSKLSIGISNGFDQINLDFSGLQNTDWSDPILNLTGNYIKFNSGIGIQWYNTNYFLSFSITRLINTMLKEANNTLQLSKKHFYLSGGYLFNLKEQFQIKSTFLAKYCAGGPLTIDINPTFIIHKNIHIGCLYRLNESIGISSSFQLSPLFSCGYSYDFPVNELRNHQNGTHEIFIQFSINTQNNVYTSPRYF